MIDSRVDQPIGKPSLDSETRAGYAPGAGRRWVDPVAGMCCLALVAIIHQVAAMLGQRYWLDEAWVAVSTKAPLSDLPWVTASSPVGWTLLVGSLPAYGQIQRLVPVAFLAGSVLAGYAFGRVLGWSNRAQSIIAGSAGAAGALLLPAQFMRHDLKQYTADAAIALLLLTLAAWVESSWSVRRLVTLGSVIVLGMLFSHPAAFVGGAVLGGLLIAAAVSRQWGRVRDAGVLAVAVAVGMGCVYGLADRAGRTSELSAYWSPYFPTLVSLPRYLAQRLDQLRPALGVPWPLFLVLGALGVVTVARMRRPGTAIALVLLPLAAVAAGELRLYPLLDQRTSHFLLVTGAVVAAIGIAGAASVLESRVAGGVVLLALTGFVVANLGVVLHPRLPGDPAEDIRAQVAYVAAHRQPRDTILVNLSGGYGFAYYWSADPPEFRRNDVETTGWIVGYPPADRIVVATGRDEPSIMRAVAAADALAGPGGRIWLVRTHVNNTEAPAWQQALAGRAVALFAVGPEPVATVTGR